MTRNLSIGFGIGRIDAEPDQYTDTATMVSIEGPELEAVIEVRNGTVTEVGNELRRLLDHAADQGWVTLGQARYRKGAVTVWERYAADDRRKAQATR